MAYTPHTQEEIKEMLCVIGVNSIEELFSPIPKELRAKDFNVKDGISEFETFAHMKHLSCKNSVDKTLFIGGGYYDHIVPSAVDALTSRSEFYTAYTPYQSEASQGTLQSLYEYQSTMCQITGMDITNASMYDGATALAEGVLMAIRATKRKRVVVDYAINPIYKEVLKTYLYFHEIELIECGSSYEGASSNEILDSVDKNTAAFVYAIPNFFGSIIDQTQTIKKIKELGVLAVASVYPISLGIVKTPYEMGADIVSADGQSLGIPLSFGGPYFGILACKDKHLRDLPGRVVGKTTDKNNKECYTLTLQAREQHIRRHRATSNICSNQNLCALRGLIFLTLIGKEGFKELSLQNYKKSELLKSLLIKIDKVKIKNSNPTFNEFVISVPTNAGVFIDKLSNMGIYGGLPLNKFYKNRDNEVLICVTEKRSKEEIEDFAKAIREAI